MQWARRINRYAVTMTRRGQEPGWAEAGGSSALPPSPSTMHPLLAVALSHYHPLRCGVRVAASADPRTAANETRPTRHGVCFCRPRPNRGERYPRVVRTQLLSCKTRTQTHTRWCRWGGRLINGTHRPGRRFARFATTQQIQSVRRSTRRGVPSLAPPPAAVRARAAVQAAV